MHQSRQLHAVQVTNVVCWQSLIAPSPVILAKKAKKRTNEVRFWLIGTDDRTWTCTLFALEPKSNVSANFTTSAKHYYYSIKSSNVKQKAESQASLYDFANFFYFYIKKLLLFADCFDIVISACGSDSVVECHLAKVKVAGPNPVSRSTRKRIERSLVVVQHI